MLLAGISIHSVPAEFYRRYEFIAFELLSVIIYAVILFAILLSVSKYLEIETLHCPGSRWHNPGENDYLYHGAGERRGTVPGSKILLEDKKTNHPEERFRSRLPASMF